LEYNNQKYNLLTLLASLSDTDDENTNTSTLKSDANVSISTIAKSFINNYSNALNVKASNADFARAKLTDKQYEELGLFINPYFLKKLWHWYHEKGNNKKVDAPKYAAFVGFGLENDLIENYDYYCGRIDTIFEIDFVDYLFDHSSLILKAVPEFIDFNNYYNYYIHGDERLMYFYHILNGIILFMNNDKKKELSELLDLFRHRCKYLNKSIKPLNELVDFSQFKITKTA
jgi:hypothetical protein